MSATRTGLGRIRTAATVLALTGLCLAPAGCRRDAGKTVSAVGSTSVQPFAEMLAEEFHRVHRDIDVEVQGGGSTAGIQALVNRIADIGMCSRSLKGGEAPGAKPVVIARDGLAIVVHRDNPVNDLTLDQVHRIFSGEYTNWSQLPGGQDRVIRPISREEGSGTREAFQNLIMKKTRISRKALTQESNGSVMELVRHDRSAIGYMSLGLVGQDLKALKIRTTAKDGTEQRIAPTIENVLNGSYSLVRPFLFVVQQPASEPTQRFLDFVLSPRGQQLLEKEGLVRAQ